MASGFWFSIKLGICRNHYFSIFYALALIGNREVWSLSFRPYSSVETLRNSVDGVAIVNTYRQFICVMDCKAGY